MDRGVEFDQRIAFFDGRIAARGKGGAAVDERPPGISAGETVRTEARWARSEGR
jgi:hypothetical protein